MKKSLLVIFTVICMISCQITERFYLNDDESVRYETELNFSDMMGYIYDDNTVDSLKKIGEFPLDTLMSFSGLEKYEQFNTDTISEAQKDFMKAMDKTKVQLKMNDEEGKMIIRVEEKNVKSFNSYLKHLGESLEKLQKEDPKAAGELSQTGLIKTMEIHFDGKSFQRMAKNSALEKLNESNDSTEELTKQMMNMFTYKMEYHFPKKINSSSLENAAFSLDGKIMTVDVPISELMSNPEKFNFKVEFE